MQNAPAHWEVPTPMTEGVALYPSEQPDYKQQCMRSSFLKEKGGYVDPQEISQPQLSPQIVDTCNISYEVMIMITIMITHNW